MRTICRWILCLFEQHSNVVAERLGYYPTFPILCDHCGELYYRKRPAPTPSTQGAK